MILVFVSSPLSMQYLRVRAKSGWLEMRLNNSFHKFVTKTFFFLFFIYFQAYLELEGMGELVDMLD